MLWKLAFRASGGAEKGSGGKGVGPRKMTVSIHEICHFSRTEPRPFTINVPIPKEPG